MTDLSLKPHDVKLLAGEVVNGDHQGEEAAFNDILKKLPETLPNSYVVSSAGLPCNADHLHFTADGQREFGRRYAEKMLNLMGYPATEPKEPYVKVVAAVFATSSPGQTPPPNAPAAPPGVRDT